MQSPPSESIGETRLRKFKDKISGNENYARKYLKHAAQNIVKVVCISEDAKAKWNHLTDNVYHTNAGAILQLAIAQEICILKSKDENDYPSFCQDTLLAIMDKHEDLWSTKIAYQFVKSKFCSYS